MKIRTETKVGIIGIITIAIAVWGVNFLKGKDLFDPQNTYYAEYTNIGGLLPTSYVFINGMKVGQVRSIKYADPQMSSFVIQFELPASIKLPTNSVAEVYNADLLGSKAMRIIIGNASTYLSPKDTLQSKNEGSIFSEVGRQLEPYRIQFEGIVSDMDSAMTSLKSLLNKESEQKVHNILGNIDQVSIHLVSLSRNLNELTIAEKGKIHSIINSVDNLSKSLNSNSENISRIITNFSNISDTLAQINFASTINDITQTLHSLSSTLNKIDNGKGNLGMLINDDNLYINLERSTKNLDSLINDIRINPKRYLNISIF